MKTPPEQPQPGQMVHVPGQDPAPDEQARVWTTSKLRSLIQALDPYVDGTLGEVSPRHASVYVSAIREMDRLWGAYYKQPPPEPDDSGDDEQEKRALEHSKEVRTRVLDQIDQLRERDRS